MAIGFVILNVMAYQHAYAMLNFSQHVERTPPPERLTLWQKLQILFRGVTIPRPTNTRSPDDLKLPCETIQLTTTDGFMLEGWLLIPNNPRGTVLLYHGYAGSRSTLLDQAHFFYQQGYATLLFDFRGSGGSDGNSTTVGYHEAIDVTTTVQYCQSRKLPIPLILYGQSMGTAAILRSISKQNVRPDAIILESVFDRMLTTVRNRFDVMTLPSFPTAELLLFWGSVQSGFSGNEHNPAEYALACDCPALILHGALDRNTTLENAQAVVNNLAGQKEIITFSQAGHVSLYHADPAQWKAVVTQFIEQQID
jgi:uncharacterized protein